MLRRLFHTPPSTRPGPPAAQPMAAGPSPKPAGGAGAVDRYDGPSTAPSPTTTATRAPEPTSDHAASALQALGDIAQANPDDASLSDYDRMQLAQAAFDACLPWLQAGRNHPPALDAVFSKLASHAVCPESAGMLATVCHASSIVAMKRSGLFLMGRITKANTACFHAVASRVHELPNMAPYKRVLEVGADAAHRAMRKGNIAVHNGMFDAYTDLLNDTETPPSWEEIAFLQQALIVLDSMNIDSAYRVRPPQALTDAPPPSSEVQLDDEGTRWAGMVHQHIDQFIFYRGGYGQAPKLWWSIGEALCGAQKEPAILQQMFAPDPWKLEAVTETRDEHPSQRLECDVHSHLIGTLYHAVLHYINGASSQGWPGRKKRKPTAVESHRDFLAQVFTALHRGIMRMPPGWVPTEQLEELHQVALDGVARDCDAYTMRARMQAYAVAAATSPRTAGLTEKHARKIAEGWEVFKSRLYTEDGPLMPL